MSNLIIGVDVSKDKLDAALICESAKQSIDLGTFTNNIKGYKKLAKKIEIETKKIEIESIRLIVEPSGGYEQPVARFAIKREWIVHIVNAFKVRKWAESEGIRAKTDRMDARLLANFAISKSSLPEWTPLSENIAAIDEMLKRKEDLEQSLRREKNRLHALEAKLENRNLAVESLERSISWLKEEIQRIANDIDQFTQQDAKLKKQTDELKKIPGIGNKNCFFILALMHRWDNLTKGQGESKALTAYVGLDPVPCASGSSLHRHEAISRKGDPTLRKYLYLGALGGIRGKSPLSVFYHRLVSRGKKKKVALIAAARKILIWAWATFRTGNSFDPNFLASS